MKTSSLVLIASTFLFSCSHEVPAPVQLIVNGDVESGITSPAHWFAVTTTAYASDWLSAGGFANGHGLHLSATTAATGDPGSWVQFLQVAELTGKQLTLSAKIKTTAISGTGITMGMLADNEGTYRLTTQNITSFPSSTAAQFTIMPAGTITAGTADWKSYSVVLPNIQKNVDFITVYLTMSSGTTGDVYFDDVSLIAR